MELPPARVPALPSSEHAQLVTACETNQTRHMHDSNPQPGPAGQGTAVCSLISWSAFGRCALLAPAIRLQL